MVCAGLDTAEYFDPRTGEWKTIASMSVRRSSVGVGVVGGESFLAFIDVHEKLMCQPYWVRT